MKIWIVMLTLIGYAGASIAAPVEITKKHHRLKANQSPIKNNKPVE